MRLIVFDCDGTLVDSQQTIITATEAALGSHDFASPDRRDILYAVGLPVDVAMRRHASPAMLVTDNVHPVSTSST